MLLVLPLVLSVMGSDDAVTDVLKLGTGYDLRGGNNNRLT